MGKKIPLTASLEDYLEAIADLSDGDNPVRGRDIAERLGVTRPSVTHALKSLAEKGLIVRLPYTPIALTPAGRVDAANVRKRHRAMAFFLEKVLGVERSAAANAACRLEHAMTPELTDRMVALLEFLDHCPRFGIESIRRGRETCEKKRSEADCRACLSSTPPMHDTTSGRPW